MEYPMRIYGMNIYEYALSAWLSIVSWLSLLLAITSYIFWDSFYSDPLVGGLLIASLLGCFILSGITGAGIRQNAAVKDLAFLVFILTGLGFLLTGLIDTLPATIATGIGMILLFVLLCILQNRAMRTRFKPRFFSIRQFNTMIRIADTMIDADGKQVLDPIEVAMGADHMFSRISSPAAIKEIRLVMLLVEWLLPMLAGRPFPFSVLGTNERRALVEKVIHSKGVFRNVAKVLKLFACAGYYGNPAGMAQVGYIPFDDRPRSQGKSQEPHHYPDPFKPGGELYGKG